MSRYRVLLWPFIMTILALGVLVSLGKWQLDRRDWKLGIIERIDARVHGEAVTLGLARQMWDKSGDVEYTRVLAVGRYLHDHERPLFSVLDGQPGWKIITPLETSSGDILLVDRGFVPERLVAPDSRPQGQIEGPVEVTGLARASEQPSLFMPENRPDENRWFWRDVPGLAASLSPDLAARTAPFLIEAEASPVPGDWPRGGVTRLTIPNRHLEYALTWFGLAASLFIIFLVYARGRLSARAGDAAEAKIAEHRSNV